MKQDLKIPKQIIQLAELGIWPGKQVELNRQHLGEIISTSKIQEFAPEEYYLNLYQLPFKSITEDYPTNPDYWNDYGALDQLDPDRALIIGDFGIGSDTCLILDYRDSLEEPSVYRLVFVGEHQNYWKKVADNFVTFCHMTGLNRYLQ